MNVHSQPVYLRRIGTFLVLGLVLLSWTIVPASPRSFSVIVQAKDAASAASLVRQAGGMVTSQLPIINGVGARLSSEGLAWLAGNPAIRAISPNAPVTLADVNAGQGAPAPSTDYPEVVGADVTWEYGDIGAGLTVAVIDTGFDNHPGIERDIEGKKKDRIVAWVDFVDGSNHPMDPNGHGTHVAGVIANSQIGEDGEWDGIAPGIALAGIRVLDEYGCASYERVIQGVQWVVEHRAEYNIRVMNLSISSQVWSPYWADPLNQAIMQAWADGIVVVAAAGNGGPEPMTIGVPGNNPYVITVGAFTDNYTPLDWDDDYLAPFSAAGPTLDAFVKPDLVAPGAHIVSTMMKHTELADEHPDNRIQHNYFWMAGTSQATATVSGAAALILSQNPGLTPNQVKYRLMYSAYPWVNLETTDAVYSMWQQGAGRLNVPIAALAEIEGEANQGMDILADIAGTAHYEGYSYYDETTGEFRLLGYGNWSGGYGNWSGGYGNWSGGYGDWSNNYGNWSGGYGNWSGGYGNWSGGYGNWSGGYGNWSGGYGNWSGGYGNWSGGYGNWSGGYGNWSGGEPWSGSLLADLQFVIDFMAGVSPSPTETTTSTGVWVSEP